MKKLTRFFATCLLVVSISAVALADGNGGITQTPPAASPAPPECSSADCSGIEASTPAQPAEDSSVDIVTEAAIFANWLAMSIL